MHLKPSRQRNRIDFLSVSESNSRSGIGGFNWRFVSVYILTILVFSFLFYNLFDLQIIEGSQNLLIASRINQISSRVLPPRGLIFDTQGRKLAYNVPAYSLYVNTYELDSEQEEGLITKVAGVMNVNAKQLTKTFRSKVYKDGERILANRITLNADLRFDQYLGLVTVLDELPGFKINVEPIRRYVDSNYFAHLIGYVGDPTQSDVENGTYSESQIGKVGIELYYDDVLRGVEGIEVTEQGILDSRERVYTPQEAKYGDNLFLTVDSKWQKKLTSIMRSQLDEVKAFASSGVIMNSDTGEIKAMVSIPSFDNNLFAGGISGKDFANLINDPKTPLLNRAIGLQLPPGSVWKVIGATAGLEEGVITEHTRFLSDRCLELPGDVFFCEADSGYIGEVDVKEAIAQSSNIFFCKVALELNSERKGIRTLIDYAERYGLGQTTGVDLPAEQKGTMASPELKNKLWNEPWYLGDECNTIIGQGLVTVTPIQMVVVASAINNGGKVIEPHLLSRVEDQSGKVVLEKEKSVVRNLNVSANTLRIIKEGMRSSALHGTAQSLGGLPGNVVAKTGSSDAGEYIQGKYYTGAHSWVIGCFDYNGENFCFITMQQWGGRGYKTVPIMKKFINCLYNDFRGNCENI